MSRHAFVATPFGTREGVDFDAVYRDYITPAVNAAGCTILRADDQLLAGDIHTDMFQQLLLADLVIVDLSIDNPNVWYELGVRHALRARGVIHIRSGRDRLPFDVNGERTLRYHLQDGTPDPDHLETDRAILTEFITNTLESWQGRKHSPVYNLIPGLREPDWHALKSRTGEEFWDQFNRWERRIAVARKHGHAGDIMVLAEEAPTWVLELDARRTAGRALSDLGQHRLALEQFELALHLAPGDPDSQRMKAVQLGRLGKHHDAQELLGDFVELHPDDAEGHALLGRIGKNAWINVWRAKGATPEEYRRVATEEIAKVRDAIRSYMAGFRRDPENYYPGVNAATLIHIMNSLTGEDDDEPLRVLEGGVRWAAESAILKDPRDYWAIATVAELATLSGSPEEAADKWKSAVAASDDNWFRLDSSRQQLLLLHDLGYRPDTVSAALAVLERAIVRLKESASAREPRRVALFSGHMIDRPGRPTPRFPADRVDAAARAIQGRLDTWHVGGDDLAVCGGACGGDLLFAEACLERGAVLELRLPFDEPQFLRRSVSWAGEEWTERFYAVKEHDRTRVLIMPDTIGPTPVGVSPFTRNNLWQLYSAFAHGPDKMRFLCIWDGKAGDGPGGTQHMLDEVGRLAGRVSIIGTSSLFG